MQTHETAATGPTEVTILSKLLLNSQGRGLTQQQARYLLGLGFTDEDKARIHELAEKNQESKISAAELRELDSYLKAGNLLAILQARARKVLRAKTK